jgi:AhpD family alkylhydroperoxidase
MHDAENFYQTWPATMNKMKARAPETARAFGQLFQTIMKEGQLSVREKELIALGIAVTMRCEPCIYAHVEKCIKAGASPEQVIEAAGVGVMMQGGPAYTYLPVVVAAIEQLEAGSNTQPVA